MPVLANMAQPAEYGFAGSNEVMIARMVMNSMTRAGIIAGLQSDTHDIPRSCGYPLEITFSDYNDKYKRNGVAKRVVDIFPKKCWRTVPRVFEDETAKETPFEEAWSALIKNKKLRLWSRFERADMLSGIGQYGVLFLGFDDGQRFDQEVTPREGQRLLYVRPFSEGSAKIQKRVEDTTDERYGQPEQYQLTMTTTKGTSSQLVHWSRVIHIADNLGEDEVEGEPRLKPVWNYILDLEKISGGGAEMFWQGAFPGIAFQAPAEAVLTDTVKADMKDQINAYIHSLTRYMTLQGVEANSLTPQVADPSNHMEVAIRLICATLGIPYRIFLGSEEAQLAGSQDKESFNDVLMARQSQYLTPTFIHPFVERMQAVGVLPEAEEVNVEWPDLNTPSNKDNADVSLTRSRALREYGRTVQAQDIIPPKFFLMNFLDMNQDEVDAIEKELNQMIAAEQREQAEADEDVSSDAESDEESAPEDAL